MEFDKIYVFVHYCENGCHDVYAVFKSKEKATNFLLWYIEDYKITNVDDYGVEEYEISDDTEFEDISW